MSKVTQEKKLKKAAVEKAEPEVSKIQHCCMCAHHDNHPSFCRKHKKYVGRKQNACKDIK